ncbi:histidine--tRNA ligase [Kallotenue papyrolyticum]|uniref:histidine--tRNA ligase n=1 Tax=Kallotenue papyrolyticum TaxID=1325125 RepID=UPI000492529E|nr:histidine--tRNA ligase [Kallotenue papyrolyticum]
MAPKAQTYKGMKDYLPREMRLRQYIVRTLTEVAERYGFEPMQTPIVEYEATLAGKIGDDEKLIYRLQYGEDRLALRYDQTVSLARVVGQYPNEIVFPFRRYAYGPSYRGERQQRGRYREFYQFDIDIVGVDSRLADAEVVALIVDALQALGFRGARVLLNHREVLTALARVAGVAEAQAAGVYRAIDKFDKIGAGGVRDELLRQGVSEAAAEQVLAFIAIEGAAAEVLAAMRAVLSDDARGLAAVEDVAEVVRLLDLMGVDQSAIAVAPRLARGLSYYTGIVFEAVIEQPPIGSLLGGGRYDKLIGSFAGRDVPTVGTAFGIERLQIVMTELGIVPPLESGPRVFVTIFSPETTPAALQLARELRNAGIPTITALQAEKLGKQFKEADQKGVPYALVLGPDELARGEVVVKDLRSGEQRSVARDALLAVLAR